MLKTTLEKLSDEVERLTREISGLRSDFHPEIEQAHAIRIRQEESLKNREGSRRAREKRRERERKRDEAKMDLVE